jgi:hypothetical protein
MNGSPHTLESSGAALDNDSPLSKQESALHHQQHQAMDLSTIKAAIQSLNNAQKVRRDAEILSTVRKANLGIDDTMREINGIMDDDSTFLDEHFNNDDLSVNLNSLSMINNNQHEQHHAEGGSMTLGDSGGLAKLQQKQQQRRRDGEQRKLEAAIKNAGVISPKEREHYNTMVAHFDLMAAKLKRREHALKQMRHHMQLDTMIRASGGARGQQGRAGRVKRHGAVALTVTDQLGTLQKALQSGDESEVLQLQDELDVLYGQFNQQRIAVETIQQKMAHMVSHSREVALQRDK